MAKVVVMEVFDVGNLADPTPCLIESLDRLTVKAAKYPRSVYDIDLVLLAHEFKVSLPVK